MIKITAYEQWKQEGRYFAKSRELRMERTIAQLESALTAFSKSREGCPHPDIIRRAFREGYLEVINGQEILRQ